MTIDPDIRDQAYQFFIEEASELLDVIENGLLTLRPDISVQKIHEIMRAAHSIKGGAASVELDTIKTIAHRLEDAFKALYSETVIVDNDLETLLLRGYDCLRNPLQSQIETGTFNEKQALAVFDLVFGELEARLGPALNATDSFIPNAADLGVDIIASIFEVDIAEVLAQLKVVLANPNNYNCTEELHAQLAILTGFAELIDLSGFSLIVSTAQLAANKHCHQPLPVIEQILCNVDNARANVLAGNRDRVNGPSDMLLALAEGALSRPDNLTYNDSCQSNAIEDFGLADLDLDALDMFVNQEAVIQSVESSGTKAKQVSTLEEIWSIEADEFPSVERVDTHQGAPTIANEDVNALKNVWEDTELDAATLDIEVTDFEAVVEDSLSAPIIESWSELSTDLDISPQIIEESEKTVGQESSDTSEEKSLSHIESTISLISDVYDSLPDSITDPTVEPERVSSTKVLDEPKKRASTQKPPSSKLSAKVALERLERMDNLVGELAINRNSLSLENEHFQRTVKRLRQRFSSFRFIIKQLQIISDKILVSPERQLATPNAKTSGTTFDSLEMDSYGEINLLLEEVLEEVFQLAESIDDVALFAGQSNQILEKQRRTLTQLRDELMWSRMVPLERVLKRFSRVIRDLSNTYKKPVQLNLIGIDVLVDRVMLEKLYDPLLHLLRNAFDHGIEPSDERRALGKPDQGTIEIRAYHQGNYTIIEIEDDGQGLNLDKIIARAIKAQLLSPEQLRTMSKQQIQQLIFEPGFSTASQVSELSGRGVGLDVVKESLQTFNGKLSLTSSRSKGTIFSLKIPLTLTLTKLVVGSVDKIAVAFTSDSIEEIIKPDFAQLKQSGGKQFLYWQNQLIRIYDLAELLNYNCTVPNQLPQELQEKQVALGERIMLILQQGQTFLALGLEHIVTEQELVIKPMGNAIAAPEYVNGCTVLADGSLVPVIDGTTLVQFDTIPRNVAPSNNNVSSQLQQLHTQTLMIVDDSSALRRTLALTLSKAGYHVLQAKDGRDAVEQLQRGAVPALIICDVEMPRLNGFEFLSQQRANVAWAQIPTVMLTSRGNHKHQTLAKHLGATDYFTKPYIEKEFVGAIANLLQKHQ